VEGPAAGDVNPYGVAFVPREFPRGGLLGPGDVIVANFNDMTNAQGTGRTIVRVNKNADPSLFFTSDPNDDMPDLIGLSTALGVLEAGFVIVGNVPSTGTNDNRGVCTPGPNGEMQDVGQGALQIIDRFGNVTKTLKSEQFLNGPWDLTVKDEGWRALVFVSNVLSGTVSRLDLRIWGHHIHVASETQIASGYTHRCDPAAFVLGPTGVALDWKHDVLYVASTADNIIYGIDDASDTQADVGRGRVVVDDQDHLHGPLGLALAPNGDLVSAQGDAVNPNPDPNGQSLWVEFTPQGKFVAQFSIEPTTPGSAFGVAVEPRFRGFRFAAVDDAMNVLDLWVVK
jgi:DNA-binding beta-propeller fold protein YncE